MCSASQEWAKREHPSRHSNCINLNVLIEHPPAATRRHHIPLWLRILGLCVLVALAAGIVLLAVNWPFSQEAMTRALQEATSRPVRIGRFHSLYFPPGCMAENIQVLHN